MKQSKSIEALQREIAEKEKRIGECEGDMYVAYGTIDTNWIEEENRKHAILQDELSALREELKLRWCDIHNVTLSEKEKGICYDCQEEMKK